MKGIPNAALAQRLETAAMSAPLLLNVEDVLETLKISRSTLWKLMSAGDVKYLKVGRAVRFRPVDVENYVARLAGEAA